MYYSSGNYEAFAHPRKPEGVENKSAHIIGTGLAALTAACDGFEYPGVGYVMRYGRPLTEMGLGFKERMVLNKVLKKIQGTEIEKLLKEYHVIG